jgi:hypothetical protein
MALRSRGPLAGLGWLKRAIHLGHGNPKATFGGAALLCVAMLVPMLISLPMELDALRAGGQPSPTMMFVAMALSAVAGLLLVPAYAGYLRVIDAAERGRPVRAQDVFAPYRQGEVLRFVGYGLAMFVVYMAMVAIVIAATGGGIARWYMQLLTAQAGGQVAVPALPADFGLAMALFGGLGLLVMGIYAISLGQVALGGRSVLGAIGDGVVGSLKNVLPLLVFVVAAVLAWIVVAIVFALAAVGLSLLGKLVGLWLVFVLMVPLYIALMLVVFVVMFGVMYHLWRDVCGDDAAPAPGVGDAIAA